MRASSSSSLFDTEASDSESSSFDTEASDSESSSSDPTGAGVCDEDAVFRRGLFLIMYYEARKIKIIRQ